MLSEEVTSEWSIITSIGRGSQLCFGHLECIKMILQYSGCEMCVMCDDVSGAMEIDISVL